MDIWVSVLDKVPGIEEEEVLVYPEPSFGENGRIVLGFYKEGKWYSFDNYGNEVEVFVTHWAPISNVLGEKYARDRN